MTTKGGAAVLGAGGWGTALARLLARQEVPVTLWARRPEVAETLARDRENRRLLPGVEIPASVTVTADLDRALADEPALVLVVVPSQGVRALGTRLAAAWRVRRPPVVSAVKGLEARTWARPTEVLAETLGAGPADLGVLTGPSHAEEVGRDLPTAVVVGSASPDVAARAQAMLHAPRFRVYTHTDALGLELAGAVKNVLAIACGIADGLGFGDNTRAALVTRGLAEMTRLGVALGARRETFQGLAGLGDLVVTCTSDLSRNRAVGRRLGRGESLAAIQGGMAQVAEGVLASAGVLALARRVGLAMPISEQVEAVCAGTKPAAQALADLLSRGARSEEDEPAAGAGRA